MDLGSFLNSINMTKENLIRKDGASEQAVKLYPSFMVSRCLSYHKDCILLVNELNAVGTANHAVTPEQHYDYLLSSISKKKRFAKLAKAPKPADVIEAIKLVYGMSTRRAQEAADMMTEDQLADVLRRSEKGGRK